MAESMETANAEEILRKYERYINPSLAKLFHFMGLASIEWKSHADRILDSSGKEYIDCLGGYGVFSLGHRHPAVVDAVKAQLDLMPLSSKILLNQPMADLAELLAEITPGDIQYSFIGNSGAEAVEGALKLARLHTGRTGIIAACNAFHGKTFGALSATGRELFREPFKPLLPNFLHVPFGNIEVLEKTINRDTAAVILEPVQGEGGINIPTPDYLPAVRRLCDKNEALLICDEVQTGLGRTGEMFAVNHTNTLPDILCLAKALGGGVMPIGAFIARPHVWNKFITSPFIHTSTFGGNPLACAAAIAAITVTKAEDLPTKAKTSGQYLLSNLQKLSQSFPNVIREVRGIGLMIGIELCKEGAGGFLMAELINSGILVAYTLNNPKVIRLEPPLNISIKTIDIIIHAFESAVAKANEIIDEL